jgi:hypothetical protein
MMLEPLLGMTTIRVILYCDGIETSIYQYFEGSVSIRVVNRFTVFLNKTDLTFLNWSSASNLKHNFSWNRKISLPYSKSPYPLLMKEYGLLVIET